jgi:hypothetical protein
MRNEQLRFSEFLQALTTGESGWVKPYFFSEADVQEVTLSIPLILGKPKAKA